MARYRNDFDDEFEYQSRQDRFERERPWNFNQPYQDRDRLSENYNRRGLGRFGERADYEYNEPRYNDYPSGDSRSQEDFRARSYEGRDVRRSPAYYDRASVGSGRSRLRVRDIMTRDLAVATRDTTLREVSVMMRDEDTGVIPVVDYAANGSGGAVTDTRRTSGNQTHGKLIGLITDRDIVVRAVAEAKDSTATRAEEIMSTDLHTARPHERVVDVIRKMGAKQVRRIPVVNENGKLLGVVSMGDIAVETEADNELADALEDISKESSFWGKVFG
ncbi:MAG TPA: CBS domain-containing protein [Pyrinomonadaceae bacterium]|nr:CBS domain-containing protein [Pyrinomonadaceae bacterium]